MKPIARQEDLDLARQLVGEAGALVAQAFKNFDGQVQYKPDGSPVTSADVAAEDLMRQRLAAIHPTDGVLGEERPARPGTSGRRWIMDPLGGTVSFVRRIPLFSVDLALEDEHGPAIAVSSFPIGDVTLAGGRGLGCRVQYGQRIFEAQVSDRSKLDSARVCLHNLEGSPIRMLTALHDRCLIKEPVHSVHRLLRGDVDAIVLSGASMGYDDLACLPVLVEEAGGRVTDLSGMPVLRGDGTVLATNGHLHDALLEFLAA